MTEQYELYRSGKALTLSPDYAQVQRAVFSGKELESGRLNEGLARLAQLRRQRIAQNQDLSKLGNSAELTQRLAGQTPPDPEANPTGFVETLRKLGRQTADRAAILKEIEALNP